MKDYVSYNLATGRIRQMFNAPSPESARSALQPDEDILEVGIVPDTSNYYVDAGQLCTMPARPGPNHQFNWTTKQWQDPRTLGDFKDARWEIIKAAREAELLSPLITPFGVFDGDAKGQTNISRSVLLANNLTSLGYPVEIEYTLADDTVKLMDAPSMIQVGLMLGMREKAVRNKATSLRTAIGNALDTVALGAIVW